MYTIKTLRQHYVLLRRSCVDNMTTGASIYPDEMDKGATSNHMGIGRMLIMWRRSVYKVVYQELIVFLLLFGILSVVYRSVLNDVQKKLNSFSFSLNNSRNNELKYWVQSFVF